MPASIHTSSNSSSETTCTMLSSEDTTTPLAVEIDIPTATPIAVPSPLRSPSSQRRGSYVQLEDSPTTPSLSSTAFFLAMDTVRGGHNLCTISPSDGNKFGIVPEGVSNGLLDIWASARILYIHLATFETLLCVVVTILTTTGFYFFGTSKSADGHSFGANISWAMISVAVVSPMIQQITQAFTRREMALDVIAEARALIVNIYLANSTWGWDGKGRNQLPSNHAARTKSLLQDLASDLTSLLLVPTLTRGRHRFTTAGRKLALSYAGRIQDLQFQIVSIIRQLCEQAEVLRRAGLSSSDVSRLNQYHWMLEARCEKLQNVKFYRTPQATRSLTRFFILIVQVFYGPYYVYLLKGDSKFCLNFGFCLALSVLTSLSMMGLFSVGIAMEDPFVGVGLDGVRVKEVFEHVRCLLDHCDRDMRQPRLAQRLARPSA